MENLESIKQTTQTKFEPNSAQTTQTEQQTTQRKPQSKLKKKLLTSVLASLLTITGITGTANAGGAPNSHGNNTFISYRDAQNQQTSIEIPKEFQGIGLHLTPLRQKIEGVPNGIKMAGEIYEELWKMRDSPEKLIPRLNELDYVNQPASYLIASFQFKDAWKIGIAKGLSENDPMILWGKMINNYVNKYIKNSSTTSNEEISQPALECLFKIGNKTPGEIESFLDSPPHIQERYLTQITHAIIDTKDKRTILIGNWLSSWLTNYYWKAIIERDDSNHKLKKLFYKHLEIPLNKFTFDIRKNGKYFDKKI